MDDLPIYSKWNKKPKLIIYINIAFLKNQIFQMLETMV